MSVRANKIIIDKIIARARRMGRIREGLVLCDNCDISASASVSKVVGWTSCAPCTFGEADSFDEQDLIHDPTLQSTATERAEGEKS